MDFTGEVVKIIVKSKGEGGEDDEDEDEEDDDDEEVEKEGEGIFFCCCSGSGKADMVCCDEGRRCTLVGWLGSLVRSSGPVR